MPPELTGVAWAHHRFRIVKVDSLKEHVLVNVRELIRGQLQRKASKVKPFKPTRQAVYWPTEPNTLVDPPQLRDMKQKAGATQDKFSLSDNSSPSRCCSSSVPKARTHNVAAESEQLPAAGGGNKQRWGKGESAARQPIALWERVPMAFNSKHNSSYQTALQSAAGPRALIITACWWYLVPVSFVSSKCSPAVPRPLSRPSCLGMTAVALHASRWRVRGCCVATWPWVCCCERLHGERRLHGTQARRQLQSGAAMMHCRCCCAWLQLTKGVEPLPDSAGGPAGASQPCSCCRLAHGSAAWCASLQLLAGTVGKASRTPIRTSVTVFLCKTRKTFEENFQLTTLKSTCSMLCSPRLTVPRMQKCTKSIIGLPSRCTVVTVATIHGASSGSRSLPCIKSHLTRQLTPHQCRILPSKLQQLSMRALLCNHALRHKSHLVCVLDSGQPVRNYDHCAACRCRVQRLLNLQGDSAAATARALLLKPVARPGDLMRCRQHMLSTFSCNLATVAKHPWLKAWMQTPQYPAPT